jgi:hypothetical protein
VTTIKWIYLEQIKDIDNPKQRRMENEMSEMW